MDFNLCKMHCTWCNNKPLQRWNLCQNISKYFHSGGALWIVYEHKTEPGLIFRTGSPGFHEWSQENLYIYYFSPSFCNTDMISEAFLRLFTSSVWSLRSARHLWMDSQASRRHVSRNVLSSETFSIEILVSLTNERASLPASVTNTGILSCSDNWAKSSRLSK